MDRKKPLSIGDLKKLEENFWEFEVPPNGNIDVGVHLCSGHFLPLFFPDAHYIFSQWIVPLLRTPWQIHYEYLT